MTYKSASTIYVLAPMAQEKKISGAFWRLFIRDSHSVYDICEGFTDTSSSHYTGP